MKKKVTSYVCTSCTGNKDEPCYYQSVDYAYDQTNPPKFYPHKNEIVAD